MPDVYKTTDNQNFTVPGASPSQINQLVWQGLPGKYIAAADDGLYTTIDGGVTWGKLYPNTPFGTTLPGGAVPNQIAFSIGPNGGPNCLPPIEACQTIPFSVIAYWDGAGPTVTSPFTEGNISNTTPASMWYAFNSAFGQEPDFLAGGSDENFLLLDELLNHNGDDVEKWVLILVSSKQASSFPEVPNVSSEVLRDVEFITSKTFGERSRISAFKGIFSDPPAGGTVIASFLQEQEAGTLGAMIFLDTPITIDPIVNYISSEAETDGVNITAHVHLPSSNHSWDIGTNGDPPVLEGGGVIGFEFTNCILQSIAYGSISVIDLDASGNYDLGFREDLTRLVLIIEDTPTPPTGTLVWTEVSPPYVGNSTTFYFYEADCGAVDGDIQIDTTYNSGFGVLSEVTGTASVPVVDVHFKDSGGPGGEAIVPGNGTFMTATLFTATSNNRDTSPGTDIMFSTFIDRPHDFFGIGFV